MARQGKGILGAPSKSIGLITGQKHSGKDTIRSKPKPSIKTQTPELATTKTNFQIASEIWANFSTTFWNTEHIKQPKHKTIKNQFIGEWLKILSKKEDGFIPFNMLTPTFMFFKWNPIIVTLTIVTRINIKFNLLPYPTKSKSSDRIVFIRYFGDSGVIFITNFSQSMVREDSHRTPQLEFENTRTGQFIFAIFSISNDLKEISNGMAGKVIRV